MVKPTGEFAIRVTFHGAVRTVTGSLHLVEAGGTRVCLDCGLYQGRRADAAEWNRSFPFEPGEVDAVILSHAHLDHCGNLPTLVAQGFRGPVFCTPATRDLAALVLRDSAKVQQQDAAIVNRRHRRQGLPEVKPLYDMRTTEKAIARLAPVPYGRPFRVGSLTATFSDAGHILGSAMVLLVSDGTRLGFTGDLGRPGTAIVRDPEVLPEVDLLLIESTYGDREHAQRAEAEAHLAAVVRETVARGGRVLIPSFAIGRVQEVAYTLHRQREEGLIPAVPFYVDSPMATDATGIFRAHPECFDEETRAHLKRHDPFGFGAMRYVRTPAESRALRASDEPCIIIATSGMMESGRILSHLRDRIGDPDSTLLFVGYQAEHTLGRRLSEGAPEAKIYGEAHKVEIRIERADAFSAHADRNELLAWAAQVPRIGRAFCVHGDEAASEALAAALVSAGIPAEVPSVGQIQSM